MSEKSNQKPVKRTYGHLIRYNGCAGAYLSKFIDKDNQLCHSIKKFAKQLADIFDEYNSEREDCQSRCCMKVKTGESQGAIILVDTSDKKNKIKCYDAEGEIALRKEYKALLLKEVEVKPHIPVGPEVEHLISQLNEYEKVLFSELIIPKQPTID